MRVENTLLAAVYASPDDDLPRLVYADFLEEQGEIAQAEYIRAQCAYDRLYAGHADEPAAMDRMFAASSEFRGDDLQHPDAALVFHPRRGFPGKAWIRRPQEFVDADAASSWPPTLEALRLSFDDYSSAPWTSEEIRRVFASPTIGRLRELSLEGHPLDAHSATELFASSAVQRLETLCLQRVSGEVVAALGAARMPSLRRLCLMAIDENELAGLRDVEEECALALDRLPFLNQLEELSLDSIALGRRTLMRLCGENAFPRLRSLRLQNVKAVHGSGMEAVAASPWFAGIVALHLGTNGLSDEDVGVLCGSPYSPSLHTLWLRTNRITAEGVAVLACSTLMPSLARLNLRANFAQMNEGVKALASSPLSAQLREVNLGFNYLGDAALSALSMSRHLAGLEKLYLECNEGRYGDEGGMQLARSHRLRSLKTLSLSVKHFSTQCKEALNARYGNAIHL